MNRHTSIVFALLFVGSVSHPSAAQRAQRAQEVNSLSGRAQDTQVSGAIRTLAIADIVGIRDIRALQISPDGTRVAVMVTQPNGQMHSKDPLSTRICVVPSEGGVLHCYSDLPQSSSPQWSPDSHRLGLLGPGTRVPGNQVYVIDISTETGQQVTRHSTGIFSFTWSPDGKRIAFLAGATESEEARTKRETGFDEIEVGPGPDVAGHPPELWIADVGTGEEQRLDVGGLHVLNMQWSPDGTRLLLTVAKNGFSDEVTVHPQLVTVALSSSRPKAYCAAGGVSKKGLPQPGGIMWPNWSPDGRSVAFLGNVDNFLDPYPGGIFICDGEGSHRRLLHAPENITIENFRWIQDGKHLLVVAATGVQRYLAVMDIESGSMTALSQAPLEIAFRSPFSLSGDGTRIACVLAASNKPPDVWLVKAGTAPKQLTHLNPALEGLVYGESEEVSWSARDGLRIPGVLIKPVAYVPGRRYPLVVQVHGAVVADVNEFEATWMNWGQLLAANGYAVLLPNYRGSLTGGPTFARGDVGDLGGKDLDDVMDGIDAMIGRGIADPNRLGIGGVSFGGYLSAFAITQSERFKAAVVGLGIADWISMAGETSSPGVMLQIYWQHYPYGDMEPFWKRSPVAYAEHVITPTFLYEGEQDTLIPVAQGREFFRALRFYGVPATYIIYPREGHGLQEPNHLSDNLSRILGWYDRFLK